MCLIFYEKFFENANLVMMMKKLINSLVILLLSGWMAGHAFSESDVVLEPGNVWVTFKGELNYPVSLDNPADFNDYSNLKQLS